MGDQQRFFEIEKMKGMHDRPVLNLRHLEANELAQQLAIATKYGNKGYKKRILAEARRRNITL